MEKARHLMKRIARACERKPYVVILIVILFTVFMAYGITRVSTTAEIRKFLPQDYPSVRTTLELENKFGRISYESVLIRSNDVTKLDIVHTILRLENTLEDDPELENYITRVEAYTDYVIPLVKCFLMYV